jgi:hypothetical protein
MNAGGNHAAAHTMEGGQDGLWRHHYVFASGEEPSRKDNGVGKSEMVGQIASQIHFAALDSRFSGGGSRWNRTGRDEADKFINSLICGQCLEHHCPSGPRRSDRYDSHCRLHGFCDGHLR